MEISVAVAVVSEIILGKFKTDRYLCSLCRNFTV